MTDATENTTPAPAVEFIFATETRKVTNPLSKTEANPDGVEEEFTFRHPVINNDEQMDALCGSRQRAYEILTQRNKGRASALFTAQRLESIKTQEDWEKHLASAITDLEAIDAPLAASRGTGVNAKAAKYDTLNERLAAASNDTERLAILKEMGW